MRNLASATAVQAALQTGSYPIRILEIDLPQSSTTLYLSDRVVSPTSGLQTLHVVKNWGDLTLEPEMGQVGGYGQFTCTVSDIDWLLFDAETTQPGMQHAQCRLYLWFSGTNWDDRLTLFSGTLAPQDFKIGMEEVVLTIKGLEDFWNKDVGFRITSELFPNIKCSECDGTIIPIVFGDPAYRIPICPIERPAQSTLAYPLGICDTLLIINESSTDLGFPQGSSSLVELVVGGVINGVMDYDRITGWFDPGDDTMFHIVDRSCWHAHGETAGIYVTEGLRWVTIDAADCDDNGDQDMNGYPIIFPGITPAYGNQCLKGVISFWSVPPDPDERIVWADPDEIFPTSEFAGEEYMILNRVSIPYYGAGTTVVEVGPWVWPANFLPSEAIDRVEVKGTDEAGNVVFYTVNPYVYSVNLNDNQFNESHLGRDSGDPGLTTITMADTSPLEEGFQDDIIYVTIRGTCHLASSPPWNPLEADLVVGQAINNPAAVIAEIASNPFLGNVSEFQLDVLQDAFDNAPIVFAFGITEQRGLWDVIGDLARQAGLLVYVDAGKLVVRMVNTSAPSPGPEWTSENDNRHKASLSCRPRDVSELPVEMIGNYRPSGGDDPQKIVRASNDALSQVGRAKYQEMDFWAIQAPSNVAYMTEWWLTHEISRNRRFTFEMFMEFLAAQPGDFVQLEHFDVDVVPVDRIDSQGRIVSVTHVAGNAQTGQMELIRLTIETYEWLFDIYQGPEPYECGVMRSTVEQPPPTVYTEEAAGQLPGGAATLQANPINPGNATTIIGGSGTTLYLGKTDEVITKTATGTVSRYDGSQSDTGLNDEVKSLFEDIQANVWVWYADLDGVLLIIRAEC